MFNPANAFHRNCTVGMGGRLPMETMMEIARSTTDFCTAVSFFKMGFPLNICMKGVSWPQNLYEPPSALFKPEDNCKTLGCLGCYHKPSKCRCFSQPQTLNEFLPPAFRHPHLIQPVNFAEMFEDPRGGLWREYSQSIEEGHMGQTFLVETWADETWEFSVARNLQGWIVASQHADIASGVRFNLTLIDPLCECTDGLIQHDAWEDCMVAASDFEF